MKNISKDAIQILAEISMEINNDNVMQSFKTIKTIDDLLGIIKAKNLLNHTKGRKSKKEKRFEEIFRARLQNNIT